MLNALKNFATAMRHHLVALYLAVRDIRTPWYARALGLAVVAYALSPIDLIPDFIPVFGLWLVDRMIPSNVREECMERAKEVGPINASKAAGAVILVVWVVAAAWLVDLMMRRL